MCTIRLYKNEDVYPFQAAYCEHFYAFKYISNTIGIKNMLQGVTVFKFIALQMSRTRSFVPCFKSASLCQCSIDTRVKPSCRLKFCGWSGWFYLYTTVTGATTKVYLSRSQWICVCESPTCHDIVFNSHGRSVDGIERGFNLTGSYYMGKVHSIEVSIRCRKLPRFNGQSKWCSDS